jgi:large subunit ribosomal protein L10
MAIRAKKIQKSKADAIAMERDRISKVSDYIFTDYRGLTVAQISALRKQLREKSAAYHIVKNNFARIAFEELKLDVKAGTFEGPTAVAYATADANEVAKILFDFSKEVPAVKVKGGLVDKAYLDAKQLEALSKLPGRNTLIAMFMAGLKSPVQKLAYTLVAIRDKMEAGAVPAAPAADAPQAPAPEAPADAQQASAPAAPQA